MEKSKPTTLEPRASSTWERLEDFVRDHVQQFIQALLEEEVTELLGRTKSARREAVDAAPGYRNGYGKPRRLTLTNGTITVRRPRVRDLNERFVSRVLPLFKRQTKEVGEFLPQLYLHGLALGDFELALRGLLGDGAPLSPTSLLRLKTQWQFEYETWRQRRLADDWERLVNVLPVSSRALAAPQNHECRRVPICDSSAPHHGSQTLQEGRERHGVDLEDFTSGRVYVPQTERSGVAASRIRGSAIPRWGQAKGDRPAAAGGLTRWRASVRLVPRHAKA